MTVYLLMSILLSVIVLFCAFFADKINYIIIDIISCSSLALLLIFGLMAAESYRERRQQKIEKNSRSISTDKKVENTISFGDSLGITTEYKLLINE